MSRSPDAIVKYFNMVEDADDPRWKGTHKRVWRSGRGRSGMLFMEWHDVDIYLDADILGAEEVKKNRDEWYYVEGWNDGRYRVVWVNPKHMATMTYCEGDLILVTLGDTEGFLAELFDARRCYGPAAMEKYQPDLIDVISGHNMEATQ